MRGARNSVHKSFTDFYKKLSKALPLPKNVLPSRSPQKQKMLQFVAFRKISLQTIVVHDTVSLLSRSTAS